MRVSPIVWLLCLAAAAAPAAAQTPAAAHVTAAPLARPPVIDGVIGDDEWGAAAPVSLLLQTQPGDNAPPSEQTEFRVGFDRDHLYVAIRAWDSEPGSVRGRVARRDDIGADDYVTLHLDTYNDRRRAYVFSFNPLGIQGDGLYSEGVSTGRNFDGNVDRTWDGVLTSKGTITDDGFVVEVAIPFKSLRYSSGADAVWGAKFTAKSGRNTYALLATGDAAPGLAVALTAAGHAERAQFAVARYQRDILASSTIGGFVTTRRSSVNSFNV